MPRYTTSQTFTEGNTQIVALPDPAAADAEDRTGTAAPEEEALELKLQRITEQVPVRISNTSGSSAGSGSGDFHQYRQMRRHEQDRLMRMEIDFHKRKEKSEFEERRLKRIQESEERTAKKRAKRQKKKEKKKKVKLPDGSDAPAQAGTKGEGEQSGGESEGDEGVVPQEALD